MSMDSYHQDWWESYGSAHIFVNHNEWEDGSANCILVRLPSQIIPRGSVLVGIVTKADYDQQPSFTPVELTLKYMRNENSELYENLLLFVEEIKKALGSDVRLQKLIERK